MLPLLGSPQNWTKTREEDKESTPVGEASVSASLSLIYLSIYLQRTRSTPTTRGDLRAPSRDAVLGTSLQ